MKKALLVLAIIMLGLVAVAAEDYYVVVDNETGYDIYFLYVSHESSDDWEEDVLGDDILWDGDSVRVDLYGYKTPYFDIHAIDEDGDTYTVWGLNVAREDLTLTLAYLD